MTTPTEADRIRVLKVVGFRHETGREHWQWQDTDGEWWEDEPDLTRDDLAAKYLLPIVEKLNVIDFAVGRGYGSRLETHWYADGYVGEVRLENFYEGEGDTFGQALHAFVLALLDAGVIE